LRQAAPSAPRLDPTGNRLASAAADQQYLSDTKNPTGYCGLGGTGVSCPIGIAKLDD